MKCLFQSVFVLLFIFYSYQTATAQFHFEFINIGRDTSISHRPPFVSPGDFNSDGVPDILVNYDNRYFMLAAIKNLNGRSLSQEIDLPGSGKFDLDDLNQDGFLDIISAKGIILSKGQPMDYDTLIPIWGSNLDSKATEIFTFVDYDNDSKKELAIGNSENISFLAFEVINGEVIGKNEDRWEIMDDYAAIVEYQFVDVDTDLIPELFVLTGDSDVAPLWYRVFGFSRLPIEERIYLRGDISSFEIGDLNSDGELDIFMKGNSDSSYNPTNEAFIGLSQNGLFSNEYSSSRFSFLANPQFLDLNGDSIDDIIMQNDVWYRQSDIVVNYNLNNSTSEFSIDSFEYLPLHYNNFSIVDAEMTDVNQDSLQDLVVNSNYGGLFVYLHTGSFPYYDTLSYIRNITEDISYGSSEIQLVDFNKDGAEDLLYEYDDKLYLMLNDSLDFFASPRIIYRSDEESISTYTSFDVDGDGFEDILIDRAIQGTEWMRNESGIGLLEPQVFDPEGYSFENTEKYDINNDGLLDLIAGRKDFIQFYINEENGSFESYTFRTDSPYTAIEVGDLDSDGLTDIIFNDVYDSWQGNDNQYIKSFEFDHNTGSISDEILLKDVSNPENNTNEADIEKIILHDFDNDGFQDIFYTGNRNSNFLHHLDGQGLFSPPLGFPERNLPDLPFAFVLDINGDSADDLITCRSNLADHLQIAINQINSRNKISGVIRLSENNICDNESEVLSNIKVVTDGAADQRFTFSYENGFYEIYPKQGQYELFVNLDPYPGLSVEPDLYQIQFDSVRQRSVNDFCVTADSTYKDIELVSFLSWDARVGENTDLILNVKNNSPIIRDASVEIAYDSNIFRLLNNIPTNNDKLILEISELKAYQTETFKISFKVRTPPEANIGDAFSFSSIVYPIIDDQFPANNESIFSGEIIGPYDPNDIIVIQGDSVLYEQKDDYLNYIIRFQNIGNSYAKNVRVENLLDPLLDWRSLELIDLSHNATSEYKASSDLLTFSFDNIFLPDSTTNYEASNGYISYRVKPMSNISVGDVIKNSAQIYFDFNDPIMTNIARTQIVDELDKTVKIPYDKIAIFPSPAQNILNISSDKNIKLVRLNNLNGRLLQVDFHQSTIDISSLSPGIYILTIEFSDGTKLSKKLVKS